MQPAGGAELLQKLPVCDAAVTSATGTAAGERPFISVVLRRADCDGYDASLTKDLLGCRHPARS